MIPLNVPKVARRGVTSAAALLSVLGTHSIAHAHGGYGTIVPVATAIYIGLPSAVVLLVIVLVTEWYRGRFPKKTRPRWAAAADVVSVACMVVYPVLTFPLVLSLAFEAEAIGTMVLCWLPLGGLGAVSLWRSRALR